MSKCWLFVMAGTTSQCFKYKNVIMPECCFLDDGDQCFNVVSERTSLCLNIAFLRCDESMPQCLNAKKSHHIVLVICDDKDLCLKVLSAKSSTCLNV